MTEPSAVIYGIDHFGDVEKPYVVAITGRFDDHSTRDIAEFHFDTLDEAFRFYDNDVCEFVVDAYKFLNATEFMAGVFDGTIDNGEALESITFDAN